MENFITFVHIDSNPALNVRHHVMNHSYINIINQYKCNDCSNLFGIQITFTAKLIIILNEHEKY